MPNPASPADVAARWRPLSSDEELVAERLLGDAWAELLVRVPTLEARLEAETLSSAVVTRVLASMVLRVLRNPDGKRIEAIDDYQYTRDDAVSSGVLYATAEELALLAEPGNTGAAFTISPFGEPGYSTVDDFVT